MWTASAIDPEGDPLEYRFLLRGPNYKGFEVTQDWRTAYYPECPTWIWTPSKRDQGLNDIRVEIGDGSPPGNCDASNVYYDYWVGPSC